ncbi:MAG: hypothetical protein OXC81_01760, partial [Betaproteobacteria bacterium]|nr:hypothetical protein [Betaproteobacteria bacterium]
MKWAKPQILPFAGYPYMQRVAFSDVSYNFWQRSNQLAVRKRLTLGIVREQAACFAKLVGRR